MVQTQSPKWWFYKGCFFSFKVMQHELNIRYRTLWFSTIQFVLQPPLQYLPLISFLSSLAIFHLIISPSEVFPNPSLQSLPTLLSTLIEKCNSLPFHTEISTVPIKSFPLSQQFSQFKLRKSTQWAIEHCEDWHCFKLSLLFWSIEGITRFIITDPSGVIHLWCSQWVGGEIMKLWTNWLMVVHSFGEERVFDPVNVHPYK